jgi:isoleucyl-tRNA synthetase
MTQNTAKQPAAPSATDDASATSPNHLNNSSGGHNASGAYAPMQANAHFPDIEKQVLAHWRENNVFAQSIQNRPAEKDGQNNAYVFYDGPPFANGLPHYGHLLTGYVKDAIARYQTMRGKRVERRFGWDCHGLPAEMGAEKELGISGRLAITDFGIDKFNDHCRTSVMKYTNEWEEYVTRQARWVDFEHDYKTMDTNFMESVLWAFKQLHDKGLVYEAYRVMPYSWAAETPLSNFETKLDNSYREREDKAVTVAFELKDIPKELREEYPNQKIVVLAWTTTPWTLPSNLALGVSNEVEYVVVRGDKAVYVLSRSSYKSKYQSLLAPIAYNGESGEKLEPLHTTLEGKDLIGLQYKPLFPYFKDHKNAFRILDGSDFITDGDGTGVVHMAPGFGEDDQRICEKNGIALVVPVDGQGKFSDDIFDLSAPALSLKGLNVIAQTEGQCADEPYKPEQLQKYGLVNLRIIQWLKMTGHLAGPPQDYKHNYPHCWRTDTPLIYRAMPSWYVQVTKFRDRAVELNKQINWVPAHVRDGQMGHMLATAPDWSISRNRFWGTPIPVWRSASGKIKVFGSIAEIEAASGQKLADLHRPVIDNIVIEEGGETYHRVEDVFDCWFESGSMPFAQLHYPFENKQLFEDNFPADFITEYVGQTRGWFNTLIMLSTALFDKPPFKNCICHGVVLDSETGLKYSKRLKNYKDPMQVMDNFGADALRFMMLASPVMRGADLAVDPDGKFIRDVVRLHIKPLWNAYHFFTLYANADGVRAKEITSSAHVLDRYILAKAKAAVMQMQTSLDAYDTPGATEAFSRFFEVLNNWYIRRSRTRFWAEEKTANKQAAYDTLYSVLILMCKAAAPLLPLITDAVYLGLTNGLNEGKRSEDSMSEPAMSKRSVAQLRCQQTEQGAIRQSVHLADFPDVSAIDAEADLLVKMDRVRDLCATALAIRSKENIRTRQPIKSLHYDGADHDGLDAFSSIVRDEINVHELVFSADVSQQADFVLKVNFPLVGKRLPKKVKEIIGASKQAKYSRNDDGSLSIAGEILQTDEYSLLLEPKVKQGAQALASQDAIVTLDLNLTPALIAEGSARDLVRMVQQARKQADFEVSDRILLHISTSKNTQAALDGFADYIADQTLATFSQNALDNPDYTANETLDGAAVSIQLMRDV